MKLLGSLIFIQVVLFMLELTKVINLSLFALLTPIWVAIALVLLFLAFALLAALVAVALEKHDK